MNRASTGRLGESEAAGFLEKKGYRVLERNYRCRFGEIDIVARDGAAIVFVEVKTRASDRFGTPGESVDSRKQLKITRTAQYYIESNRLGEVDMRFDVVGVGIREGVFSFELIRDAFEAAE